MTNNQIYSISGELYDDNSLNLLKLDTYTDDLININKTKTTSSGFVAGGGGGVVEVGLDEVDDVVEQTGELFSDATCSAWITVPQRGGGASSTLSRRLGIGFGLASDTFFSSNSIMSSCHPTPRVIAEFSEFGLDALDPSSISPSLLHDVSLNREVQMATNLTTQGDLHHGLLYSTANHHDPDTPTTTQTTSASAGNDTNDNIVYQLTNDSHELWNDLDGGGVELITTKTEPVFSIDDDYIFQIDKTDLAQEPTLAELNHETLFEDLNVEDLVPSNQNTYLIGGGGGGGGDGGDHHHHHQSLPSPQSKYLPLSAAPPQQLLQQQQQPQHVLHHVQHQQPQQQQQPHTPQRKSLHYDYGSSSSSISHSHPKYGGLQMLSYEDRHNSKQNVGSTGPYAIYCSTPKKSSIHSNLAFSPGSQGSSHSHHYPPTPNFHGDRSAAHYSQKIISPHPIKTEYPNNNSSSFLGQSVPGPSNSHMILSGNALSSESSGFGSAEGQSYGYHSAAASRLSTSAPTHLGMDQIWQRREPRQHLLSSGSLTEAESISSLTTGGVLSPEGNEFSQDEGYSDYDSDHYEDCSSDNGSDNEDDSQAASSTNRNAENNKLKERFFWQYNVQAKGPKGQRLVIKSQLEDPHVLNEITDPVFSPNCSVRGIKHSGKARKGDGNDLTPNPRKLYNIGKELDKLGRTINDMTPVSELPFNVRPKSRKEKNKLASRACRLKKKAQHEANKIKLFGLELEHKKLIYGLNEIKRTLAIKYVNQGQTNEDVNNKIEMLAIQATSSIRIAGGTTDFVNRVIENVKNGVATGGLDELRNT